MNIGGRKVIRVVVIALISAIFAAAFFIIRLPAITAKPTDNMVSVKITAMAERSNADSGVEVWVREIDINGDGMNFETVPLSDGWTLKNGMLFCKPIQSQTINIPLPKGATTKLTFLTHKWSGMVEVDTGTEVKIIDLYVPTAEGGSQVFEFVANGEPFVAKNTLFQTILQALLIWILVYLGVGIVVTKKQENTSDSPGESIATTDKDFHSIIKKYLCPAGISTAVISALALAFVFSFSQLFFTDKGLVFTLSSVFAFLGYAVLALIAVIAFLFFLEITSNKIANGRHNPNKKIPVWLIIFIMTAVIWSVYLFAFFPGNMSGDSTTQWNQAHGSAQLCDDHPLAYTGIIRLCTLVWDNPAAVVLFQIVVFAAVIATFAAFLHKKGISFGLLVIFCAVFAALPNNGIMVITVWKDVLFTAAMLWLTYFLIRLLDDISYFKKPYALIGLAVCLLSVTLIRQNGMIPFVFSAIFFATYAIVRLRRRSATILCALVFSLMCVLIIKGPVFDELNVVPTHRQKIPLAMGIGAALNVDGGTKLSEKTMGIADNLMPIEKWIEYYNPYSSNDYTSVSGKLYKEGYDFYAKLTQYSTGALMNAYLDALAHYPAAVIQNRFSLSNIILDVNSAPAEQTLYIYYPAVDVTPAESDVFMQKGNDVVQLNLTHSPQRNVK